VTTTHDLEQAIRTSLGDITTHWDAMLTPTSGGTGGGSATARITADDHADTEADIDRTTRIVSLRRFTVDVLNGWSRVVMEDRPVEKALPNGSDAKSMAAFLDRHAQWMSGHDAAGDCAGELADVARRITALVAPPVRDYVNLGDCPFVVGEAFCYGKVRARIGFEDEASCTRCGQTAVVEWWEDVLGIGLSRPCYLPALVAVLRDRLHVTVTDRTLRNWHRDQRITALRPFGPEPRFPRFDPRRVLDEVASLSRQCPTCGTIWDGKGELCVRCYVAMQDARPLYAEPKRPTPVARSLRPVRVVPDSHDTDRPERCHYSDLPVGQCACGRHRERVGA